MSEEKQHLRFGLHSAQQNKTQKNKTMTVYFSNMQTQWCSIQIKKSECVGAFIMSEKRRKMAKQIPANYNIYPKQPLFL